jgi:hypothetical protein
MLVEYGVPVLHWLAEKTAIFALYIERWIVAIDPGEDEDGDVLADYARL